LVSLVTYKGPERRRQSPRRRVVPVRLTRKLAEQIDGIDLSRSRVGDRLALSSDEARLLIAEGWAEPVPSGDVRG